MNDKAPQQPEDQPAISEPELVGTSLPPMPPAPPTTSLPWTAPPQGRGRKRAFIVGAAAAILLIGSGITWWALAGDGDPMDHVEVSGGKLVTGDSDSYSGSDDATYEFVYKITNKGDEPANYSVIVNGFGKNGDFISQTYIGTTHLEAGKTDADKGEFDEYVTLEDGHELSDIKTVKVAWVERMALAN